LSLQGAQEKQCIATVASCIDTQLDGKSSSLQVIAKLLRWPVGCQTWRTRSIKVPLQRSIARCVRVMAQIEMIVRSHLQPSIAFSLPFPYS
jgi:hypothetical protein